MIEQTTLHHHIQKYIVEILLYKQSARFSELRPPRVDTNLFSYHLKLLQREGFIDKTPNGYTLSSHGLAYVDRVSSKTVTVRRQPKIITMLLVQNKDGQILLQKRTKQPYINAWTLPYGKIHIEDTSVGAAAQREAWEKLGLADRSVRHVGDCYIRVYTGDTILSTTLAHVFRFESDDVLPSDTITWAEPTSLHAYTLAPAVEQIVARSFFGDKHFFAEFDQQWEVR